ncbi:MAG: type 4a pilus biogenesis protein PilO [Elusimicrobiota bacterium]
MDIKNLTKRQLIQIIVGFTVLVLVLIKYVYLTVYNKKTKIIEQYKKIELNLNSYTTEILELQKQQQEIKPEPKHITKQIPQYLDASRFLDTLDLFAKKCKIEIEAIKPAELKKQVNYVESSYQITASGELSSITRLLKELENTDRIITLAKIELKQSETKAAAVQSGYTVDFTATIYGINDGISAVKEPKTIPEQISTETEDTVGLNLTGIIWNKNKPVAIINGISISCGEKLFDNYHVKKITKTNVVLDKDGKVLVLTLK